MLKIDGLSHRQLAQALGRNRLPHLKRLIQNGSHHLRQLYSGIPSSTPAVQGELFYGVKTSVPAFAFFDRRQNKKMVMLRPAAAGEVARHLEAQGRPLLRGGTSYSNIYTGGADEARYCIETMKLRSLRQIGSSFKLFFLLALKPFKLLRMLGYGFLEAGLALYDLGRGVGQGKSIPQELKFVPTRVLVCILLRELIRTRVKMDLARGVPIVHASFLGYDEQAHRRGPDSAFAHWTLKGIDEAIGDIHRTARRSQGRDYRLIIYSDHGQERALPYAVHLGESLEQAVQRTFGIMGNSNPICDSPGEGRGTRVQDRRGREFLFSGAAPQGSPPKEDRDCLTSPEIQITAMGPIGHLYLPGPLSAGDKLKLARGLIREAHIPLVLFRSGERVMASNRHGDHDLESRARDVLGGEHPCPEPTAADLARTCRHPHAGDLILSGWRPDAAPLTFAMENGAHGGPGREEVLGFALLPQSLNIPGEMMRPAALRAAALALMGQGGRDAGTVDP
ncbi:MAG: alkaline phosphatase family protein [Desulfobacterales bacterium]